MLVAGFAATTLVILGGNTESSGNIFEANFFELVMLLCSPLAVALGQIFMRKMRQTSEWTVTAWVDEASMLAFRDSGPHGRARPKKPHWFNEAAIAHWQQKTAKLPTRGEAADRLRELGRLSNVRFPSPAQAMGEIVIT